MKRVLTLAALFLAFACGDERITLGLEEPFAVQDAQFIEGPLPGGPPDQATFSPRATAVTTEVSALRPRLASVPFFGWATIDAVSVAARIEGLGTGYWVLPTGPIDPAVQGEPVRVWRFLADLHASLPPGRHRLLVAATNDAGQTGNQVATAFCVNRLVPDNGNVCDPKKAPPEIVVSVGWDTPVDLDLVVVTPAGEHIASRSPSKGLGAEQKIVRSDLGKTPPGVGFLENDSNSGCRLDGRQIENVVFQDRPAPGSYLVYVNLHDTCGEAGVRYTVTRHQRAAIDATSFTVVESERHGGALTPLDANGSTRLGTFVSEFIVP